MLDEADRMLDMGFEDELKSIFAFFKVSLTTDNSDASIDSPRNVSGPKTNFAVLSYNAEEDSELRKICFGQASGESNELRLALFI